MLIGKNKFSNRGDTIVEVMIVLAVLGFAISISFATANRSLLNARQAQENSEATAYVQSQVEALQTMAALSTATTGIFDLTLTTPFCITDVTAALPYIEKTTLKNCDFETIPYSVLIYPCDRLASLVDTPCAVKTDNDTFIVRASWPDVFGGETDTVTMSYRIHAP